MQSPPVDTDSLMNNALEYFQTDDENSMYRAARALEDKNDVEFSDLEMDTSLFPYYTVGPFNPPLPTMQDILAAKKIERAKQDPNRLYGGAPGRQVVRVGPYFVKYGTTPEIFQVRRFHDGVYRFKLTLFRKPKISSTWREIRQFECPNCTPPSRARRSTNGKCIWSNRL
jgi:hypothetical protein